MTGRLLRIALMSAALPAGVLAGALLSAALPAWCSSSHTVTLARVTREEQRGALTIKVADSPVKLECSEEHLQAPYVLLDVEKGSGERWRWYCRVPQP